MPAPRLGVAETVSVPLDRLKPYPRNARAGDIELITESLRVHGQYRALVVQRSTNQVLAGNHTLHALYEIGVTEALVHYLDVDDDQAARINLVDNRANDVAKYEDGLLADLLRSLEEPTLGTGWSEEALEQLYERVDGPKQGLTDPDVVPEVPERAVTQPGDLWRLGEHRLLCGDATQPPSVQHLLAGRSPQLLLTDPPYCSGGFQEAGRAQGSVGTDAPHKQVANDRLSTRGYQALLRSVLALSPAAFVYIFTDWRMWLSLFDVVEASGLGVRSMIVWDKGTPGMGRGWRTQHELVMWACSATPPFDKHMAGQGNVIASKRTGNPLHTVQKPVDLLETLASVASFADGIYDPFAGSGSTLIAAEQTNRVAYCMEIDPLYCDVICRRCEEFTGVTPILEATGKPHSFVVQEQAA